MDHELIKQATFEIDLLVQVCRLIARKGLYCDVSEELLDLTNSLEEALERLQTAISDGR